jgi:hypothetical protein
VGPGTAVVVVGVVNVDVALDRHRQRGYKQAEVQLHPGAVCFKARVHCHMSLVLQVLLITTTTTTHTYNLKIIAGETPRYLCALLARVLVV